MAAFSDPLPVFSSPSAQLPTDSHSIGGLAPWVYLFYTHYELCHGYAYELAGKPYVTHHAVVVRLTHVVYVHEYFRAHILLYTDRPLFILHYVIVGLVCPDLASYHIRDVINLADRLIFLVDLFTLVDLPTVLLDLDVYLYFADFVNVGRRPPCGVIGGVAGLVAIICALLFIRSRLHKRRGVAATNTFRKWDGLSSRESGLAHGYTTHSVGPSAYHTSAPTRHPSTGSTAAMLGRKGSIGYGAEYDDEKFPGTAEPSSHGHEPLEYAAPTTAYAYDFPSPMIPATPSTAFSSGRPRDRSHSQSRALALAHLETASQSPPPPVTPISPYNFNHSHNSSLDGRVLASPPTSPSGVQRSESIRMNRTSIGRHPTRKPVPKYDESESVEGDITPSASPTMSPTQVPSPDTEAVRDSVYYDSRATPSASSSSSNLQGGSSHLHSSVTHAGTSLTAVRSREDLLAAGYQVPKLSEKTSFGSMRNVHYLIPDPPPKAMD
ncbi:hypothetical protein EIP86_007280 [Pleurotus ostreatoroseus]|nr:hypothetical protein EIP86_007280 [Pleurotus ostreatoroseus]